MEKLFTCDDCGYALLTKDQVKMEPAMVFLEGSGWGLDKIQAHPIQCGSSYDCMRRRRDRVAGRRVIRNIDRRHARYYAKAFPYL